MLSAIKLGLSYKLPGDFMASALKKTNCDTCPSRGQGIFCELEMNELSEVSQNKVTNVYKRGQTIFYQGNPSFGLYCINSGKIKISKTATDGKESIIRIASPGDVLGHRSLFSNENYTATATALEDTTICFLDKKFIFNAIQKKPSVALNIIKKLSVEMGAAEQKCADLFQKNVRERLAEHFLGLMKNHGVKEEGRTRLDVKLTREEIASIIGTASETVIRFITEFKNEGLIEQEGKDIYVLDEERLKEFANIND
jgi:CRP-like cAMP-binding protein